MRNGGEVRITGIASTLDPATVQLRSLTDPAGVTVSEQRFVPGATTPDEILARHVGDQVTIVTPKGEVSGVLRSVDPQALVIEVGTGDTRLQVMRRDGYVQDIRLPGKSGVEKPSLVWRLVDEKARQAQRRGHLSRRWPDVGRRLPRDLRRGPEDDGLLGVGDAAQRDGHELRQRRARRSSAAASPRPHDQPVRTRRARAQPRRSRATRCRRSSTSAMARRVQVELVPTRVGAKARSVVTFESVQDLSATYQGYPATDCTLLSASVPGSGRAEIAVEVDVPAGKQLPDGRVRVFKRPQSHPSASKCSVKISCMPVPASRGSSSQARPSDRRAPCDHLQHRRASPHDHGEDRGQSREQGQAPLPTSSFASSCSARRCGTSIRATRASKARAAVRRRRSTASICPPAARKSVTYTVTYSWELGGALRVGVGLRFVTERRVRFAAHRK